MAHAMDRAPWHTVPESRRMVRRVRRTHNKHGMDNGFLVTQPFRRRTLLRAAAAFAASSPGACARAGPLAVGYFDWPGFAFLPIAAEQGLLPAADVSLLRFDTAEQLGEAVREGRVAACAASLAWALSMRAAGVPVRIIAVCDVSAGADALLARPGIATPADLAGRRVALDASPRSQILCELLLARAGLAPGDIVAVPLGRDAGEQYRAGAFDAVLTRQPYVLRFEQAGLRRLADSSSVAPILFDVLAVREDALAAHRAGLVRLVGAHFEALRAWRRNRVFHDYRLARTIGIGVDEVQAVYAGLDLPDAAYNRHYLESPQAELRAAARACTATLRRLGLLRGEDALDGLFTAAFLPGDTA